MKKKIFFFLLFKGGHSDKKEFASPATLRGKKWLFSGTNFYPLRYMGTFFLCFSTFSQKMNNIYEFLFASLRTKVLHNWGLFIIEKICSLLCGETKIKMTSCFP